MSELQSLEREEAASCAAAERRAWVRYGTDLEATCRGSGTRKGTGWPARVKDISNGGIGLVLRHRFRPGTYLAVELHDPSGGCLRCLAIRVVHASPLTIDSESCWFMGCLLSESLTEEEVQALLLTS